MSYDNLKLGDLIDTLIVLSILQTEVPKISETVIKRKRLEAVEELNRREDKLLDAVKGDKSSPVETQNFDEQPELVIIEDFQDIWMKLNRLLNHHDMNIKLQEDRDVLVFVMNMFQNRAIIKDSSL